MVARIPRLTAWEMPTDHHSGAFEERLRAVGRLDVACLMPAYVRPISLLTKLPHHLAAVHNRGAVAVRVPIRCGCLRRACMYDRAEPTQRHLHRRVLQGTTAFRRGRQGHTGRTLSPAHGRSTAHRSVSASHADTARPPLLTRKLPEHPRASQALGLGGHLACGLQYQYVSYISDGVRKSWRPAVKCTLLRR